MEMSLRDTNWTDLPAFEKEFDAFILDFDLVFDIAVDHEQLTNLDGAFERGVEQLEVAPRGYRPTSTVRSLVEAWRVFAATAPVPGSPLARRLETSVADVAERVFARMEGGRLGLWRASDDGQLEAEIIDGSSCPERVKLGALVDEQWEDIPATEFMIGWAIPIDATNALLFAVAPQRKVKRKIEAAARRHSWGEGDQFRRADYREDILSLLLDPDCFDTGRDRGRIFLSSFVENEWYLSAHQILPEVRQYVFSHGLDPEQMREPHLDGFIDPRRSEGGITGEDQPWSSQLAAALACQPNQAQPNQAQPNQALALLRHYRATAVPWRITAKAALGDRSMSYVLCDELLFAAVHLDADGRVDHPTAQRWGRYKLATLDLSPSFIKRNGLDDAWTIEQALAWAPNHLADQDLQRLHAAADKLRQAMLWVGLVNLNAERSAQPSLLITYRDLLVGIRTLLPTWAAQTPLSALQDPGRGTWKRMEKVFCDHEHVPVEPPLRIGDLPDTLDRLTRTPGIGKTSGDYTWHALYHFVLDWPQSCGHQLAHRDEATAQQAADHLSDGLDALDDLF
jgi:hypothetical protein